MRRLTAGGIALCALIWAGSALALGLGEIDVRSHLNQNFSAVIPLLSASSDDVDSLNVQLAGNADFERAGVERADYLSSLRFAVAKGADGAPVLRVSSPEIAREPFLSFVVEARWNGGKLIREYTVLLDPPASEQPVAPKPVPAPVPAAATSVAAPAAAAPPAAEVEAPAPAPTSTPKPAKAAAKPAAVRDAESVAGTYGPVHPSETLWSIAAKLQPGVGGTMDQVLLALHDKNPSAFEEGSIDRLMKGTTLKTPSAAEVQAIDPVQAKARIAELRGRVPVKPPVAPAPIVAPMPAVAPPPVVAPPALKPEAAKPEPAKPEAPKAEVAKPEAPKPAPAPEPVPAPEMKSEAPAGSKPVEVAPAAPVPATPAPVPAPTAEAPKPSTEAPPAAPVAPPATPSPDTAAAPPAVPPAPVPVAEPAKAAPASPEPANSDEESGLLMPALIGVGVLLLGILGVVMVRRRKAAQAFSAPPVIDLPMRGAPDEGLRDVLMEPARRPSVDPDALTVVKPQPVTEPAPLLDEPLVVPESKAKPGIESATPEFEQASAGGASQLSVAGDATDPLADADFHVSYGLFDEAANILKTALVKEPLRLDLKRKLIEVYYAAKKPLEFEELAEQLRTEVDTADWHEIVERGRQLAPNSALFKPTLAAPPSAPLPDVNLLEFDLSSELPSARAAAPDLSKPSGDAKPAMDLSTFDLAAGKPERVEFNIDELDLAKHEEGELAFSLGDEIDTKLDLARAYADMGDSEAARNLLTEVIAGGSDKQKSEAQALYDRLSA